MKCNWEWLSAYLDGALSDDKRARLEEHLKTCEACAAKLEEFARVEQAAKKIPVPQLSEAYWENFASRVQNKLTIREREKASPRWLGALKSFFQPTTGKLAIAGSLATILLVVIIGMDYWKKETYQPPKFEAVAPVVEDKIDSAQEPAKDELAFRTARPDENKAMADKKRENEIASAKTAGKGIIDSREDAPAAPASTEIASKPAGRQKTKEEPSLAASVERDEAIKGDTVVVTAGKKAEIRKEVATSQVKLGAEEIEKPPNQNASNLLKLQQGVTINDGRIQIRGRENGDTVDKNKQGSTIEKLTSEAIKLHDRWLAELLRIQRGVTMSDGPRTASPKPATKQSVSAGVSSSSSVDTTNAIPEIQELITRGGEDPALAFAKSREESLYIVIGKYYRRLNRFWPNPEEIEIGIARLDEFLQKELSDSTHQRLLQIQTELKEQKMELKKLKK